MKYEICHIEGDKYAHVTRHAFANDVTARIAMQWIRNHDLDFYIVEVPEDEVRPLLPGLIATLPRVKAVLVRCRQDQEAAVRSFVPFSAFHKLNFSRYGEALHLCVPDEEDEAEEDVLCRLKNLVQL